MRFFLLDEARHRQLCDAAGGQHSAHSRARSKIAIPFANGFRRLTLMLRTSLLSMVASALTLNARLVSRIGRELIAGTITPPVLGGVVAAGIAGSKEPEGRVLRLVPRRLQEAMRESRIAWIMYSQFEYVAAGLAVAALAGRGRAGGLLKTQRAGPDYKDVACGGGACCDVYLPAKTADAEDAPTYDEMLVFVPGGAWSHGYKSFYTITSRRLADEFGCPVAVVGYDLYPIANGAEQVAQVDEAMRWAEAGAPLAVEDGSPLLGHGARVIVAGHSAGGHLAATALLRRQIEEDDGEGRRKSPKASIGALALLSAPLELRRHIAHEATRGVAVISALSAAFVGDDGRTYVEGDEAAVPLDGGRRDGPPTVPRALRLFDDTQPLAQLSPECLLRTDPTAAAKLPAVVALYHGASDPVVPVSSTERFEGALRSAVAQPSSAAVSVCAQYPSCSHLDYILQLITDEAPQTPPLVSFLRETCWVGSSR